MGNCAGRDAKYEGFQSTTDVLNGQHRLQKQISFPLEVQVAHYMPSSFPLLPTIDARSCGLCRESWERILKGDASQKTSDGEPSMSSLAVFYDEFYSRLEMFDTKGQFEAILSRHGKDSVITKGAILVRIVGHVLSIHDDSDQVQLGLYMLGKAHASRNIRPWQYAVFVQTLLLTISSRLGTKATNAVMEAWVNQFAFVMQGMLPAAIRGQVVETEININTSSEFDAGRVAEEVAEVEAVRQTAAKFALDSPPTDEAGPLSSTYQRKSSRLTFC